MDVKQGDLKTKQKIMDEALRLFAEKGLEGTSTREIAKASESNISLISYYFGGKEGLYKEIIKTFAVGAQAKIEHILKLYEGQSLTVDTFVSQLKQIITEFVSLKASNPEMSILMQREALSGLPFAFEIYNDIFTSLGEKIVSIYKRSQKLGFVKPELHPYILFFSLVHSVDYYVSASRCETKFMQMCPKLPDEKELFINQLVKIFVEGALK